jgi:hypothetical protein
VKSTVAVTVGFTLRMCLFLDAVNQGTFAGVN